MHVPLALLVSDWAWSAGKSRPSPSGLRRDACALEARVRPEGMGWLGAGGRLASSVRSYPASGQVIHRLGLSYSHVVALATPRPVAAS
jgi:hypothetical protein